MGSAGVAVDETVEISGIRSGEVADRLLALASSDYRAVKVAANRFEFARTYRPTWAIVVGITLTPLIVGLLFFLIKTSETWTATVEEDHRSVRLRISGSIKAHLLLAIREAMSSGPTPVMPVAPTGVISDMIATPSSPMGAPQMPPPQMPAPQMPAPQQVQPIAPPAAPPLGRPTAPEPPPQPDLRARGPVAANVERFTTPQASEREQVESTRLTPDRSGRPSGSRFLIRFDDGIETRVAPYMLLGRAPQAAPTEQSGELLPVDDRSVSKTHLSLRADSTGVWVTDRNSTNGTIVVDERSQATKLSPGDAVLVRNGATVRIGGRSFQVVEVTS